MRTEARKSEVHSKDSESYSSQVHLVGKKKKNAGAQPEQMASPRVLAAAEISEDQLRKQGLSSRSTVNQRPVAPKISSWGQAAMEDKPQIWNLGYRPVSTCTYLTFRRIFSPEQKMHCGKEEGWSGWSGGALDHIPGGSAGVN